MRNQEQRRFGLRIILFIIYYVKLSPSDSYAKEILATVRVQLRIYPVHYFEMHFQYIKYQFFNAIFKR